MADKTPIEWTDATWNPIVGCSVISPGCTNCYAMRTAARLERMMPPERRGKAQLPHHYTALTQPSKAGPVWTGRVNIAPEHILTAPLHWGRPRRIFVNSMSDLFHESVPDEWIDRVFAVMALSPQHTFQVLTKRPERMRQYFDQFESSASARVRDICYRPERHFSPAADPTLGRVGKWPDRWPGWPLPNVWLGVSVEDQRRVDERVPILLDTPAAIRWVSAEPLLGPLDLRDVHDGIDALRRRSGPTLDWVVAGGESGPNARPMHPDWARSLRDQCASAGVPFLFKQWGEWVSVLDRDRDDPGWRADYPKHERIGNRVLNLAGGSGFHGERVQIMQRVGKKAAGRLLDGVLHDAYPRGVHA